MARRFDLGSVRLCVSAAEPLPAATYESWVTTTGKECLDGIGSTEMFHIFVSSEAGRVRPGATGVPVPGYDCRVVDEEGREGERAVAVHSIPPESARPARTGAKTAAGCPPEGAACPLGWTTDRRLLPDAAAAPPAWEAPDGEPASWWSRSWRQVSSLP